MATASGGASGGNGGGGGTPAGPASQRIIFWSNEIDFKTPGDYPLLGVPNAPGSRFLLSTGKVWLTSHSGSSYAAGPLLIGIGLSIGGVLTYKFTSDLSIPITTINAYTSITDPAILASPSTITTTPWQALDLTGLAATPVVTIGSGTVVTGAAALRGKVLLDGFLIT